ncbi:MAG: hypothetical protein MPJ08_09405, partial [Nitrosopumilus sp.]|nr:hypothetical protein [Nitrosopumilus sp.]
PEEPGRYEITTYVWSSLVDSPEALAAPSTAVIHVAEPGDPPKPATGVVTVSTDKGSYDAGEPITIRGHVGSILGFGVTIQVFAPDAGSGNVVFRGQPTLSADGTFEAQVPTDNTHMKWPGEYTVRAEYGGAQRSAETTFLLTEGRAPVAPTRDPDTDDAGRVGDTGDPAGRYAGAVTVSTGKGSYEAAEQIEITGRVSAILGYGVTVQVFAPDAGSGNVVFRGQPTLSADGTFETRIPEYNSLMRWPGEYTVRAEYGGAQRSAETTFLFTSGPAPVREPAASITGTAITVGGSADPITYEITGGRVLDAVASPSTSSLILDIEVQEDGIISLSMPRTILDAAQGGQDIGFFVIIDAEEGPFTEIRSTSTHRVLNIPFSTGNTEIEIVGTFAVS